MKNILALVAVALLTATASQAATINLEVHTAGRWVRLIPGSGTNGRVVNGVTDRAARGESVRANFAASTPAERNNPAIRNCYVSSKAGSFEIYGTSVWLPSSAQFTVPLSPAWDDNYVNIVTISGHFKLRIPVALR